MKAKRYTRRLKRAAIARLRDAGYPNHPGALNQVALDFGIPRSTLQFWFHNPLQPVRPLAQANIAPHLDMPPTTDSSDFSPFPASPSTESRPIDLPPTVQPPTVEPTELSVSNLIAFYTAELAQIRAILHTNREEASYKDLLNAHRLLTADLNALQTHAQHQVKNLAETRAKLYALLEAQLPHLADTPPAEEQAPPDHHPQDF